MKVEVGSGPAIEGADCSYRAGTAGRFQRRMRGRINTQIAIGIGVVGAIVALYLVIGGPDVVRYTGAPAARPESTAETQGKLPSVGNLLEGLEEKLEQNPADGDGWLLLAKSYHHLGRGDDARKAYANAVRNGSSDASLEALLASTDSAAGEEVASAIHGRVSMAPELISATDPEATVFVMAKDGNGSPMPLAVIRKTVRDLPFDFTLNDDQSMVRGRGLSSAETVLVMAKVSSAGDALTSDPGLEASLGPVRADSGAFVELVIGQSGPQQAP